jgi:hypothetical protein
VTLLISTGHQTGLFDTSRPYPHPPLPRSHTRRASTSDTFVNGSAGWRQPSLLSTNRIQPGSRFPHQAAALIRAAGIENMAKVAQLFSIMGKASSHLEKNFDLRWARCPTPRPHALDDRLTSRWR